ncbi:MULTISPECIES: hypothetical protein [Streptomyces]|nr:MULTISPECIES: hypothetical protein [Streptomyces]MCH0560443.1 hypothetical protein [Streptomyces sp. MUM 16J]
MSPRQHVIGARAEGNGVEVTMRNGQRRTRSLCTGHVVVATGRRVSPEAVDFLAPDLRTRLVRRARCPHLDAGVRSSVPSLYSTGTPAAATFGPLLRFTCGTGFAAPRLAVATAQREGQG